MVILGVSRVCVMGRINSDGTGTAYDMALMSLKFPLPSSTEKKVWAYIYNNTNNTLYLDSNLTVAYVTYILKN